MKPAILIPTLNRYDLLDKALFYYTQMDIPIFICDNGGRYLWTDSNVTIIKPNQALCVAASWNLLVKEATKIGHTQYFIFNDDIEFRTDKFLKVVQPNGANKLCVTLGPTDFYAAYITKEVFDKLGMFDERFKPAYYEDVDFLYRCKLEKITVTRNYVQMMPDVHRDSSTIRNFTLLRKINMENLNLYISKWGGPPNKEKSNKPLN